MLKPAGRHGSLQHTQRCLGHAWGITQRDAVAACAIRRRRDAITDVLKMATENGARLLNFDKVGKIRPGWAADLAAFNVAKLEYSGSLSDPLAAIVFSGFNHGAQYTIVNGQIAVDDGRLAGIDEDELMHTCNTVSNRMINA